MTTDSTTRDQIEVVRWYTRARKFPKLIGRTHTGGKIWGGPYTITQFITGGMVLFVGANTMGIWGGRGLLMDGAILAVITWGAVAGIGKIPVGSRNPLAVVAGAARATFSPRLGHLEGRSVQARRPRQVHHAIAIPGDLLTGVTPPNPDPARDAGNPQEPAPLSSPAPAPTAPQPGPQPVSQAAPQAAAPSVPLTGVQALLAATPSISRSEDR